MLTPARRHLLVCCASGAVCGIIAIMLLSSAINAFLEARTNTIGGSIPVFVGRGWNREWIDDEWAEPSRYRSAKQREGLELAILAVAATGLSLALFFSARQAPKHEVVARRVWREQDRFDLTRLIARADEVISGVSTPNDEQLCELAVDLGAEVNAAAENRTLDESTIAAYRCRVRAIFDILEKSIMQDRSRTENRTE